MNIATSKLFSTVLSNSLSQEIDSICLIMQLLGWFQLVVDYYDKCLVVLACVSQLGGKDMKQLRSELRWEKVSTSSPFRNGFDWPWVIRHPYECLASARLSKASKQGPFKEDRAIAAITRYTYDPWLSLSPSTQLPEQYWLIWEAVIVNRYLTIWPSELLRWNANVREGSCSHKFCHFEAFPR